MANDYDSIPLIKNEQLHRFEMTIHDDTAFIEFAEDNNILTFIHTEVPESLQGKGVGSAIIEKSLSYAKANGFGIKPICPFVHAYLKRHPEWNELLSK